MPEIPWKYNISLVTFLGIEIDQSKHIILVKWQRPASRKCTITKIGITELIFETITKIGIT
jgi:hypothetical protein